MKILCLNSIMKMLLVAFLSVFYSTVFVTGASQAVCPPIVIEEGYDVTLQCRLDPPIDVSALTLDWKRLDLDKIIHVYRDGKDLPDEQMERYKGRTTLSHEDLKQGILTLKISSVQLNDSGQYECYILQLKTSYVMNISVDAAKTRNIYVIVCIIVGLIILGLIIIAVVALVKSGKINCRRRQEAAPGLDNNQQEILMNEAA